MINIEEVKKICSDCNSIGHDVRVRDIAYIYLLKHFKEKQLAYSSLFGQTSDSSEVDEYDKSKKMKFLKKYISSNYPEKEKRVKSSGKYKDISFEENKDALIEKLAEIDEAKKEGKIEYKDAIKMEVDIRTRLNDKFEVSEKQDEQRIIVQKKYNDVCVCGREIYRPTRDDIIEDLMEEYDLIPKTKTTSEDED